MPKRPVRHNGSPRASRRRALLLTGLAGLPCYAEQNLDWVPLEQLTPAQKQQVGPSCSGLYVDPLSNEAAPANLDLEPICVDANAADMVDGQQVQLRGKVDVRQGTRRLHAGQMSYDKRSEEASLEGGVEIRQPGTLIRGKDAKVNMSRNEARFNRGQFVLHATHLRGSAEQIEQRANGEVILHKGEITSCEPGNETWLLEGEELKIDPKAAQGSGRDITVKINGVPVFYTPYIVFPVGGERQSGLLFPTLGASSSGLDYAQPWYWNIAPNMDATVTPRYSSGHGAMLETELRRLDPQASNAWHLAFLPNDQGGANANQQALIDAGTLAESKLRPFKGDDRWLANWQQQGGFDRRWYTQVDYTQASDIDYLRDLSVVSFNAANNTFFNQALTMGYNLPNWRLNMRLQSYQNLLADLDETYRQVPRLNLDGDYHWGSLGLQLNNEYVSFDHSQTLHLDQSPIITGERSRLDYQLNWNSDWSFGFVQPALGVQALAYDLNTENLRPGANPSPQLSTEYASLDAGLVLERDQGQQTLEPRLFYLYRGFTDHSQLYNLTSDHQSINFDTTPLTFSYNQLFRDRRFAGGDRLDDANQMALSVTSRWFDDSARERISGSLGQLYYFNHRQVFLGEPSAELSATKSDLAGQISIAVNQHINTHTDLLYDPSNQEVMRVTTGLNFNQASTVYNLGYRYVRDQEQVNTAVAQTINQLDFSLMRPLNPQWSLAARSFYDMDGDKPLDTFAGITYDDCCYKLKLLARRWLDSKLASLVKDDQNRYDQGIFFEVELKGLGSSGNSIEKLLQEGIIGFPHSSP